VVPAASAPIGRRREAWVSSSLAGEEDQTDAGPKSIESRGSKRKKSRDRTAGEGSGGVALSGQAIRPGAGGDGRNLKDLRSYKSQQPCYFRRDSKENLIRETGGAQRGKRISALAGDSVRRGLRRRARIELQGEEDRQWGHGERKSTRTAGKAAEKSRPVSKRK